MPSFNKNKIPENFTSLPTSDNVYIDIKVANIGEDKKVPMRFTQMKSEAFLDNPSNYYLSLIRWSVPAFSLPLHIMPIQNNQPDINLSQYSITLETSSDIRQEFLFFTPRTDAKPPSTAIPTQRFSEYYWIESYQHMLDMVNQALALAFSKLTGKPIDSSIPFMIYDTAEKLFSIVAQLSQYGVSINPLPVPPANPSSQPSYDAGIKIWMNYKLYTLFNGMPSYFPQSAIQGDGRDNQLLIQDYHNNTFSATEIRLKQDLKSIATWSPVKQILFETSLIPISKEYTSLTANSFKKILTDFEPSQDSNRDYRQSLQYFPQGVYRLIDCIGTHKQYNVDLFVTWTDVFGNEYCPDVPVFQMFTGKLLFIKKNLYKTNNLLYEN